jgi:hypothetical protein
MCEEQRADRVEYRPQESHGRDRDVQQVSQFVE